LPSMSFCQSRCSPRQPILIRAEDSAIFLLFRLQVETLMLCHTAAILVVTHYVPFHIVLRSIGACLSSLQVYHSLSPLYPALFQAERSIPPKGIIHQRGEKAKKFGL